MKVFFESVYSKTSNSLKKKIVWEGGEKWLAKLDLRKFKLNIESSYYPISSTFSKEMKVDSEMCVHLCLQQHGSQ